MMAEAAHNEMTDRGSSGHNQNSYTVIHHDELIKNLAVRPA